MTDSGTSSHSTPNNVESSPTEPLLRQCPICRAESQLLPFKCCEDCATSLKNPEVQYNPEAFQDQIQPIISSTVLEECSVAIANSNYEDIGCIAPKAEKEKGHYYKNMNEWIELMNEVNDITSSNSIPVDQHEATKCVRSATYISFFINFCLLIGKAVAVSGSVSYTLISSLADSALDLIAGTIISCTAKHSKFTREDLSKYPVGKSRVSTVGILVFSVLMACCACYIIIECIQSLLKQESSSNTLPAIIIMICTIGIKLTMAIVYFCIGHPITKTLAEDHRNDVLTNTVGLLCYWGSSKFWWLDPAGGIILSLFILFSWGMNAKENAKMLMGESAPEEVVRALTYVASNHHPLILSVEQVIAFQVGPMYFAELHIVVPGHIPLEVAHWIGESLQLKVERIPDIERAWVHVDCETHNENEHLLFMRATGKLDGTKQASSEQEDQTDSNTGPIPEL